MERDKSDSAEACMTTRKKRWIGSESIRYNVRSGSSKWVAAAKGLQRLDFPVGV